MIAKNFRKFPEALRFQREMFSNGYKNSPRIMRLMQVIFDQSPGTPDWWKCAKRKGHALAKSVKKSIADFFKDAKVDQMIFCFEDEKTQKKKKTEKQLIKVTHARFKPTLEAQWFNQDYMGCGGQYRSYCRVHQAFGKIQPGQKKQYSSGFSK